MITQWTSLEEEIIGKVIPAHFLDWITKPHILSHAIKAMADFSLEVVSQDYGVLFNEEACLLKSEDQPLAIIRQKYLLGNGHPYVFVRVCIPYNTYKFNKKNIDGLGNKSIGESLLYSKAGVSEGPVEVKAISIKDPLLRDATLHNNKEGHNELWARRSVFNLEGHLLLITEVFLPTIPSYMKTYSARIKNH